MAGGTATGMEKAERGCGAIRVGLPVISRSDEEPSIPRHPVGAG